MIKNNFVPKKSIQIDQSSLDCLMELISLYKTTPPTFDQVKKLLMLKLSEKSIEESYASGLITQDEVCSFILAHVYTQFVRKDGNVINFDSLTEKTIKERLKNSLFVEPGS